MNLHEVDRSDLADVLRKSAVLKQWDRADGSTVYVAEYAGNEVLIFRDLATGGAVIVESEDGNYGGSIHEMARHAARLGTL